MDYLDKDPSYQFNSLNNHEISENDRRERDEIIQKSKVLTSEIKVKTEVIDELKKKEFNFSQRIKTVDMTLRKLNRNLKVLIVQKGDSIQDTETANERREKLIEKQKELSLRLVECADTKMDVNAKARRKLTKESEQNIASVKELQATIRKLAQRQKELEFKRENHLEQTVQSSSALKRLDTKNRDTKRYRTMIMNELAAIASTKKGKNKRKSRMGEQLQKKKRDLDELIQNLNRKIQDERNTKTSLEDETFEIERETRQNELRISAIKKAIPELNIRFQKLKEESCILEEKYNRLETERLSLVKAKEEAHKVFSSLERRIEQFTKNQQEMETDRLKMEKEKQELFKKKHELLTSKHQLELKKKKNEAKTAILIAKNNHLLQKKQILLQEYDQEDSEEAEEKLPVSVNVETKIKDKKIKGILTITMNFAIFNTVIKQDEIDMLEFCVDVKDIENCMLVETKSSKTGIFSPTRGTTTAWNYSQDKDSNLLRQSTKNTRQDENAMMSLSFEPRFENIFLFEEDTGNMRDAPRYTEFSFWATMISLEMACKNLRKAVRGYHKEQRKVRQEYDARVRQAEEEDMLLGGTSYRSQKTTSMLDYVLIEDDDDLEFDADIYSPLQCSNLDQRIEIGDMSEILSHHQLKMVIRQTDSRFRLNRWKLIYSITRDGVSLAGLYKRCAESTSTGTVIIIRTAKTQIFGGFASMTWKGDRRGFYGDADSFVYRFDDRGEYVHYASSGKNKDFILSDSKQICFGGGNKSNFAIQLDSSFLKGTSGPCETFDSPKLSCDDLFECRLFEAWSPTGE